MNGADRFRVLVFAKAPVPGAVKTRLIPRLGAEGATRLHKALVQRTLKVALDAGIGAVELCCAPHAAHPFFADRAREFAIDLTVQSAGDLGDRMGHALQQALRTVPAALLIGTDCPALATEHLRAAAAALEAGSDMVFVPAEDGGYTLVGARRIDVRVFDEIAWGSARVMDQTRRNLKKMGWAWTELPTLWDLDRPEDLDRLPPDLLSGLSLKHTSAAR
jgi:hypothetical protein